ncbi:MAG: DinB family protein [Bacteroidota bacterium]|nr:DinB family protein [Bacteroidota bacterium]
MNFQEKIKVNTEALFQSVSSLTDEQAAYKPLPEAWSVLECLEHLFLVDSNVARVILTPSADTNVNTTAELFGEGKLNHLLVAKRIEFKVPAPEFVSPTGRFNSLEEVREQITQTISKIILNLEENDITKETRTLKHPRLGEMTKTDWVHFMIAHTNRHIQQIGEITHAVNSVKAG